MPMKNNNIIRFVARIIGLVVLIKYTKVGMAMRAVSRDFETAQLMGIKINNVISMTFVIGSFRWPRCCFSANTQPLLPRLALCPG